ncbi:MAG: hypothetical protein IPK79_02770 [Vampirovibrionales bacterium]|nr:hypothetical protein [Vampirovibrionales bacterium]
MPNKRWYDQDPTLSMAISLLRNISSADQAKICNTVFQNLESQGVVREYPALKRRRPQWSFLQNRRETMDDASWYMLETLKGLSRESQLDAALTIIELTYRLDAGVGVYLEDADPRVCSLLEAAG